MGAEKSEGAVKAGQVESLADMIGCFQLVKAGMGDDIARKTLRKQ